MLQTETYRLRWSMKLMPARNKPIYLTWWFVPFNLSRDTCCRSTVLHCRTAATAIPLTLISQRLKASNESGYTSTRCLCSFAKYEQITTCDVLSFAWINLLIQVNNHRMPCVSLQQFGRLACLSVLTRQVKSTWLFVSVSLLVVAARQLCQPARTDRSFSAHISFPASVVGDGWLRSLEVRHGQ